MNVSVILPTYNESGNIVELVDEIIIALGEKYIFEIIIVDDNSPDGTYKIVKDKFQSDGRVIPVLRVKDRGFAKSIRAGIEQSRYEQLVVMDTDFTHNPKVIPQLLHVALIYDLVSASRFAPGGDMQDTPHYIASLFYNWLLRIILRTQIQDNLGGFFTAKRKHVCELPLDIIFEGYGEYYFRCLHYMQQRERTIVEIPAIYETRTKGESKSHFIKMMFTYFSSAIKLKFFK